MLTFNKFDPSLGTLTAVTITLDSMNTVQSQVIDTTSDYNHAYSNVETSGGQVTVTALDGISTMTSPLMAGPFTR